MLPLLMAALLAQPDAGAASRQLVIWGGGTSRAEAEAALGRYQVRAKDFGEYLTVAPGYPRILESATVPGLKPGFFIVALGVCEAESVPGVLMLDAWEPAVYTRPVASTESGACPRPADRWEAGGQVHAFGAVQRVETKAGELSALVVTHQRTEEGGESERKGWTLWVFLRKGARVVATQTVESGGDFAVFRSLTARGDAVVLVEEHTEPSCYAGGTEYAVERRTHTLRARGEALEVSTKGTPLASGSCGR